MNLRERGLTVGDLLLLLLIIISTTFLVKKINNDKNVSLNFVEKGIEYLANVE